MEEKSKPKFYLKWPWNLVVYIALILVLRIFAIPVILVLSAWNKKQQPDGPAEGAHPRPAQEAVGVGNPPVSGPLDGGLLCGLHHLRGLLHLGGN